VVQTGLAQKKPAVLTPNQTRMILVDKARALEARGRPDMAIQLWQQILLSDPNNAEALAGMAKDYKLTGSTAQADQVLDRLRKVNPNDPNIARIAALTSTRVQSDQLRTAGELAGQGKTEAAMDIYRKLYGDHPPDGDIALAYYQTLYGTPTGKEAAIAAMRALAQRNPGDTRYAIELGRMLTYESRTRAEGIRILKDYPKDDTAQEALRQALVWDSANPASAGELRQYLKEHPRDAELTSRLKENEYKLAQMNSGIARTPAERAAFAALNAHRLDEAQSRFEELLRQEPNNGRVEAGMGFLRMQQSNFGAAISYLTQAEQDGYKAKAVESGLETSRFWYTMGEASQAFDDNQFEVAAEKYQAALAMRPRSPEALNGMAGLLTKEQQYAASAGVYDQLIKIQPRSLDAWRGLFLAYARDGQNQKALTVSARFPAPVRAALVKDPEYLRTLATIYQAQNRNADAQRALAQALALPFPENGANLKTGTRLQYAGILMEAHRFQQAAELYTEILNDDAGNLPAWMGLVGAHHELGQDNEAIAEVQRMPPATYESALGDPGFLSMLGSIYAQANQFEVAQGLLERSAKLQIAAGGQPGVPLQLQLAAIYLQRNNTTQAYQIYRQVLESHPERADAWKGLIATLQVTNRNTEALAEIAQIPPQVRKQLENDIEFVQTEASLYAATGDNAHAVEYMNRVRSHYAALKTEPPASIEIQNAWLLLNTGNDRGLYPALMRLGGRQDLTAVQRETVQNIWANWSVRRAGAAIDNGNLSRAVDILDAASQAFPDNMTVRKAVAGGYARVGRAKESLALYKTVPMQDASATDFQGAIGAALAANDKNQAELWLRQALDRFPRSPAILSSAARFEQARGDNQRAAEYWRASLAALPQASPADRLAHTLVYPDQDMKAHRAMTAADLQHLLDPNYEPFPKTTKVPPLPAYGADPYTPGAPVALAQPLPAQQQPEQGPEQNLQPRQEPAQPPNFWFNTAPAAQPAPASGSGYADLDQPQTTTPAPPEPIGAQSTVQVPQYETPVPDSSRRTKRSKKSAGATGYEGVMNLPAGVAVSQVSPQVPASQSNLAQTLAPGQANPQNLQSSTPVVHSVAADSWKGLINSLRANDRVAEAFQAVAQIPPDVRRELEGDVEFMQCMASLYVANGDVAHATEYLNRVENYYMLRRLAPPPGIDVQNAWLLFNTGNDQDLYPALRSLDARRDLTAVQRQEVQNIWADWSLRRAGSETAAGNTQSAEQILAAAARSYPDNLNVRRAMAGVYVETGRASDSLAIFKSISMQGAKSPDFVAAVGAAMAAKDMRQAEVWLRQALDRFPSDPTVLALAARFEQAQGNSQRASDYWRASLAAMPPGSSGHEMDNVGIYPRQGKGVRRSLSSADLKMMLDPANQPAQAAPRQSVLPSYHSGGTLPVPGEPVRPYSAPQQNQQLNQFSPGSSTRLLPPLPAPESNPAPASANIPARQPVPGEQMGLPASVPVYIPPTGAAGTSTSQPKFIEQSATQDASIKPAAGKTKTGKQSRGGSGNRNSAASNGYSGQVQLPPSEENVDSIEPLPSGAEGQSPLPSTPKWQVQTGIGGHDTNRDAGLRITSQPVDSPAARALALFAEQMDSQLTQGSASVIHALPNASAAAPSRELGLPPAGATQYQAAQYTPSAQEAATGAYSAPRQTTQQAVPEQKPSPQMPPPTARRSRRSRKAARQQPPPPVLANAPTVPNPDQTQVTDLPAASQSTSGTGLSDEELEQRNLPPLRGPWVRIQREQRATSPRDEAEMQLRSIESGYSAWLGGTGLINYRSGDLGYDHLSALEAPFEVSAPLGYHTRLTFVAKPVFLDSGQANGNSVMQVTTLGQTSLTQIPQPLGTLLTTDTTPPPQQNAAGIAGEVQLAFPHLAIAGGYTPAGFLVSTFTARGQWKPGNGPFTFSFIRDSVKDTQLSYGGLRDPGSASLSFPGNVWGGAVANQVNVQYARGDAESGFYFGAGGQYIKGYNIQNNTRVDGTGGAYWRLLTSPEYGNLSIGVNFFAMHYANNERAFTYGMGGYFSPQAYFLANVPFTWAAHSGTRWHYNIMGSLGVQAFQEQLAPLFPLVAQKSLEVASGNLALPAMTSVGPNYDLRANAAYQIGPHWFAGGFLSANNSRNYSSASAGFFVRYLFRSQPSTVTTPTGLFPTDGLRPFTVP
jgi:tetratricopeptide (TPR) repeat protein